MDKPESAGTKTFVFHVDIMIEEETNGRALETLLRHLNSNQIQDYKIVSGIELGRKIETALKESKTTSASIQTNQAGKDATTPFTAAAQTRDLYEQMNKFKTNNTLIRLTIVKGKGIKLSIPCRIINIDADAGNITVYHVDEKKVYTFKFNEIDDFEVR